MIRSLVSTVIIFLVLPVFFAGADIVTDWNQTALMLSPAQSLMDGRNIAIAHTAVYNAVTAFGGNYNPYGTGMVAPAGASQEAAATTAAYHVLYSLYTTDVQRQAIQARYDSHLAEIADGAAKDAGIAFGTSVGQSMLMLRSTDGAMAAMMTPHADGTLPGEWRRTASGEPMAPGWGNVTPWTMLSGSQFDQGGPPALTSQEYLDAYNETMLWGGATSALRNTDQANSAIFWREPVPRHWHGIARNVSNIEGFSLEENARLFALLSVAMADANIAAWDMKYNYSFWRPETAIQLGDADTNDLTAGDPTWQPFLMTPPHPEYVSAHSITSATAARILELCFGSSTYTFQVMSMMNPELGPRTFNDFWDAVDELGRSRIYGGIHFEFSNQDGQIAGMQLANYVYGNFMTPVPEPATLIFSALALMGVAVFRRRK